VLPSGEYIRSVRRANAAAHAMLVTVTLQRVSIASQVSEITSALIAHYDNTPFWILAGTNKDDLE